MGNINLRSLYFCCGFSTPNAIVETETNVRPIFYKGSICKPTSIIGKARAVSKLDREGSAM